MGVNQSKAPLPNEKLVIERLRALEVEDQSDYVQVDEKALSASNKSFKAPWTALSTSEVEHWEKTLLQVCCIVALSFPACGEWRSTLLSSTRVAVALECLDVKLFAESRLIPGA